MSLSRLARLEPVTTMGFSVFWAFFEALRFVAVRCNGGVTTCFFRFFPSLSDFWGGVACCAFLEELLLLDTEVPSAKLHIGKQNSRKRKDVVKL